MVAVFVALAKARQAATRDSNQRIRPTLSQDRMRAGCWLIKESREEEEAEKQRKRSIAADNAQLLVLRAWPSYLIVAQG